MRRHMFLLQAWALGNMEVVPVFFKFLQFRVQK